MVTAGRQSETWRVAPFSSRSQHRYVYCHLRRTGEYDGTIASGMSKSSQKWEIEKKVLAHIQWLLLRALNISLCFWGNQINMLKLFSDYWLQTGNGVSLKFHKFFRSSSTHCLYSIPQNPTFCKDRDEIAILRHHAFDNMLWWWLPETHGMNLETAGCMRIYNSDGPCFMITCNRRTVWLLWVITKCHRFVMMSYHNVLRIFAHCSNCNRFRQCSNNRPTSHVWDGMTAWEWNLTFHIYYSQTTMYYHT